MPISAALKHTVDQELTAYCERKIPLHVRDKGRLVHQWHGIRVTLIEQRPWWKDETTWLDSPVAQFRFNYFANDWTLYWRDRNQRWHRYEEHLGSRSITCLLVEVDQDPTGIFWG